MEERGSTFCADIFSRLLRCSTVWGSSVRFSQMIPTKFEACKSFLFTESSLKLKIKNTWLIFIITLFFLYHFAVSCVHSQEKISTKAAMLNALAKCYSQLS